MRKLNKRILNVGCGNDTYGTHFIDLYPSRKEVIKCDVDKEKFPFPSNYFDEVFSRNLIEHLTNPSNFLKESYRVLKKGGKIIVITDNASYWVWAVSKTHHGGYRIYENVQGRHYQLFTPEHLINYLKKFGFRKIKWKFIRHSDNLIVSLIDFFLTITPFSRMGFKRIKIIATK